MSRLDSRHIPNFIKAVSEKRLRSLMKRISARQGGFVQFFDFQQLADGKFICWYVEKANDFDPELNRIEIDEVT